MNAGTKVFTSQKFQIERNTLIAFEVQILLSPEGVVNAVQGSEAIYSITLKQGINLSGLFCQTFLSGVSLVYDETRK